MPPPEAATLRATVLFAERLYMLLDVFEWSLEEGRLLKRAGFGRLEMIRDYGPGFAARYCAKYMSKDAGTGDLVFTEALLHPDAPRWGRLD